MADITMHIMKVGRWNNQPFSEADFRQMIENFNLLASEHQPPLKLGHNDEQEAEILRDGQPALGWVKSLVLKGKDLYANCTDVPSVIIDAIKANRYRTVSVEIWNNVRYLGKPIGIVLKAVSLLGADIPAVSGLKDLKDTLKGLLTRNPDNNSVSFEGDSRGEVFSFSIENGKINERSNTDMELKDQLDKALARLDGLEEKFGKQGADLVAEKARADAAEAKAKEATEALEKFSKDEAAKVEAGIRETFAKSLEDMVKAGSMQPQFRDKLVESAQYTKEGMLVPAGMLEDYTKAHAEFLKQEEIALQKKKEQDAKDTDTLLDEKTTAYAKEHGVEYHEAQLAVLASDPELAKNFGPTSSEGGDR